MPYLSRPYQYVSPYVKKADDLGDKTLSHIDQRFPVVTKPTAELYNDTKSMVLLPYRKSVEGGHHIIDVYSDERKQHGDGMIVPLGKALFGTVLVVTTETLTYVRSWLNSAKREAQEVSEKAANN